MCDRRASIRVYLMYPITINAMEKNEAVRDRTGLGLTAAGRGEEQKFSAGHFARCS